MAIKRLDGDSFRHGFCNIVCKAAIATPVKVFLKSNFEGAIVISRLPGPTQMMKQAGKVQGQVFEN